MLELRPCCPHCGSPDYDVCADREKLGLKRRFYYVVCDKCEACGPTEYTHDKAVESWAQRLTFDDWLSSQEEVQQPQ